MLDVVRWLKLYVKFLRGYLNEFYSSWKNDFPNKIWNFKCMEGWLPTICLLEIWAVTKLCRKTVYLFIDKLIRFKEFVLYLMYQMTDWTASRISVVEMYTKKVFHIHSSNIWDGIDKHTFLACYIGLFCLFHENCHHLFSMLSIFDFDLN